MKNLQAVPAVASWIVISAMLSATSPSVLAQAQERFTEQQRVGYLGETSRSSMARNVLDRLRNTTESRPVSGSMDRVLMWHEVLLDAVALDHTPDPDTGQVEFVQGGPTRTSRAMAMTQIAVFDSVSAIEQQFELYSDVSVPADVESASQDVAIAYAAHDVLATLFPAQQARLDALLASDLATIDSAEPQFGLGREVGESAAQAILAARNGDNSTDFEPDYGQGGRVADGVTTFNGTPVNDGAPEVHAWSPDPLTPEFSADHGLALGAYWGGVTPFVLQAGDQFRAPPPPSTDAEEYVNGVGTTSTVGASIDTSGSTSTPEYRFIGNFWGYDATPLLGVPPRLYNQIAAEVAVDRGIENADEMAQYLAMVNTALADAAIAAWDSKYYYDYCRPVTCIREDDGIAETLMDPDWKPVGVSVVNTTAAITPTPPFPAYPSGHATFGAALFETMRQFFGDGTAFTFVSEEYNGEGVDPLGVPRPLVPARFASFQQAQEENGMSRIYNGVHWPWDNDAGQSIGVDVARYLQRQSVFQPVQGGSQ